MYTIFGNSNVELFEEVGKIDTPNVGSWKKTFLSLDLRISKNILHIGEAKVLNLCLCIPFPNRKVFLKLNQKLLFHALSKCRDFIGTPSIYIFIVLIEQQGWSI